MDTTLFTRLSFTTLQKKETLLGDNNFQFQSAMKQPFLQFQKKCFTVFNMIKRTIQKNGKNLCRIHTDYDVIFFKVGMLIKYTE